MKNTNIDPVKLDRLAEVAIKVGLNLQKGQDLVITAPVEALPLVRLLAKHAYKNGSGIVTPFFSDEELSLARYTNTNDDSYDKAADWLYEGMAKAYGNGAARLAIAGDNPALFADVDAEKVGRVNQAASKAARPAMLKITNFETTWNIISYPTASWAKAVFPKLEESEAVAALADAIFKASRVDGPDAIAAWKEHNQALSKRSAWLNEQNFASLHFFDGKTDLTVGLADEHSWQGGASQAKTGIVCNPNMPTEEVFTTPHARKINGVAYATKPLSHNGTLIEDIMMRFAEGRAVEVQASKGQEVLEKLVATDEGAARLGEVALVPYSSPISASGLLFYNTLYDENAACHIALGQCYSKCFKSDLSEEQMEKQGGNKSLIHVDWMIGSQQMNIDGIKHDGTIVPVFRKGEWA